MLFVLIRAVLSFITFIAAYFFSMYIVFVQIMPDDLFAVADILALVFGVFVAAYVWRRSPDILSSGGFAGHVIFGAVITGALGFTGGFFGPMIFAPDANQGPLLGLFITGPLGFLGGGVAGAIVWFARRR